MTFRAKAHGCGPGRLPGPQWVCWSAEWVHSVGALRPSPGGEPPGRRNPGRLPARLDAFDLMGQRLRTVATDQHHPAGVGRPVLTGRVTVPDGPPSLPVGGPESTQMVRHGDVQDVQHHFRPPSSSEQLSSVGRTVSACRNSSGFAATTSSGRPWVLIAMKQDFPSPSPSSQMRKSGNSARRLRTVSLGCRW